MMRAEYLLSASTGAAFGLLFFASALARIVLDATPGDVALIKMAPHVGMVATLLVSALAAGRAKVPFVVWPNLASRAALVVAGFAVVATPFVWCVVFAFACQSLSDPPRTALYQATLPAAQRGSLVGSVRAVQALARVLVAGGAAWCLYEWPDSYRVLYPVIGLVSLALVWPYRRAPDPRDAASARPGLAPALRHSMLVLVRDRAFARFMGLWFVFGLANLMAMPLMVLLVTDVTRPLGLGPSAAHSALLLNVVPPVMWLLTLGPWGRVLDRTGPVAMRGPLNIVWALCPICWGGWPLLIAAGVVPPEWLGLGPVALVLVGFYVGQVLQGFAHGGTQLIWTLGVVPYARDTDDVAAYMAVHTTLTGIRGLIAPPLALVVAAVAGIPATLVGCGVVMAATGVLTMWLEREPAPGIPRA
jgi:hypothetical protein